MERFIGGSRGGGAVPASIPAFMAAPSEMALIDLCAISEATAKERVGCSKATDWERARSCAGGSCADAFGGGGCGGAVGERSAVAMLVGERGAAVMAFGRGAAAGASAL